MKSPSPGVVCLLLAASCLPLSAQDGTGFSLNANPAILLPLSGSPSADRYELGFLASLGAEYVPPEAPYLSLTGALDYSRVPSTFEEPLSTLGLGVGGGLRWSPLANLSFGVSARGGLALGMLGEESAATPYAAAGANAVLYLTPSFRVSLGGGYLHQFAAAEALYQGASVSLSAGFNFSQMDRSSKTEIRDIIILPVFPVFYKYYDTNTLGSLNLRNVEGGPIRNVRVSLFIKQYMDAPKECAAIPVIARGESVTVDLYALFTRDILSVLEPTKAQAEISVAYEYSGGAKSSKIATTVFINHRNSSQWDDDRKAASFVTMNDPAVMRLAKAAAGIARAGDFQTLDSNLRIGLGILEQLRLYGVRYVPDPTVPYAAAEKDAGRVDYLQFPAQTMEFRAGDCDDMSILYASLLEAAGVESAFITVPGHIYVAFALGMPEAQARSFFGNYGDLIERDGKVWLPVEVTLWNEGFMRAWTVGARQWREAAARSEAVLLPVREAWRLYEPVAMIGSEGSVELPQAGALSERFRLSMKALIDREMEPFLAKARSDADRNRRDPRLLNRVGVVYARYGIFDKAEEQFRSALALQETGPAYANLGNILFYRGDYRAAQAAYRASYRLSPASAAPLVGLSLCAAELDDREGTERHLRELAAVDRSTAERYAYLGSSSAGAQRAADASGPMLGWEE